MTKRKYKPEEGLNPYKSPTTPKLAEALGSTVAELDRIWKAMGVMNDMEISKVNAYGQLLTLSEYREKAAEVAISHYHAHLSNSGVKAVLIFMRLLEHHKMLTQPVIDNPYTYIDIKWAMSQGTRDAFEVIFTGKLFPSRH